ncbi:hypothetical protein [Fundidesulfovibrio terrae]|uniref:hypothetical protein n=1 Tax=Fundidesulfovibrio terrae TaxID=2922866 RepID=UPI001FAEFCAB|nr:hypothetical protein [Fundidesulfovibrio terrae]
MTRSKGLLIVAAIFLTGAAVGALGLEAWHAYRGGAFGKMERMGPAGFIMDHMNRELGLSSEQQAKIRPLVEEMVTKMDEARKPCFDAGEAVLEKYQGMIRTQLTPDQAKKHDEFLKRLRARGPHGPPPGGPGLFGGPPPPPPGMFGSPPPPPPQ